MNRKSMLAAAAVAAITSGAAATAMTPVYAADTSTKAAEGTAVGKKAERDLIRVSQDAAMVMRNVRGARLAIFHGMPDEAQTYADAANSRIDAALRDVDKYALDIKHPKLQGEVYVPFNAGFAIDEKFVPDETSIKHISKANKHLHKGQPKQAIQELKLGEIDVGMTTEMVPLKLAKTKIGTAAKMIREGKYYEANLALKAVEDAVLVESYEVDSLPKTKAKTKSGS